MSEETESMTESSAVISIQPGASWGEWLRDNGGKLLLFARQQTRSHADAEDILQEALVKLSRKVNEGTFDGGQPAWLSYVYTSIRRCAIDLGRKDDRRSIREEKVEADRYGITGGKVDPWFESCAADDESKIFLEQGLKELPEKFAEVIVLKIWGEQTFAQIGESLDISQNTAASRYRYGIEALRKALSKHRDSGDL